MTRDDVAWTRMARSGLVTPFASPVAVARALVGVQSQFVPPAGLAIRNRIGSDFTASALDRLLQESKELIRLWGQRRTVHVYDAADWPLVASLARTLPSYRERLVDLLGRGEDELEAVLERVAAHLRGVDRASRADLVEADASLEPWFQYGNGVIMDLVKRGIACHAALVGGKSYFAHREVWLPDLAWDPPATDEAGAALARRYFGRYGPATLQDFTFWLGAKAGDARRWAGALGDELVEVAVEGDVLLDLSEPAHGRDGGADPAGTVGPPPGRGAWPLRLLHRFDPLLLAHKDKGWLVDDDRYKAVWRKAGYVEAVILRRGRIAGTWGYEKKSSGISVWLAPFARLPKKDVTLLEREAGSVAAYFGSPLTGVEIR